MTRPDCGPTQSTPGVPASTGVVALGNPLRRDDGVAMALFERLRERPRPDDVALLDLGEGGFRLLYALADYERAVLVDAVDFGGDPGEYATFAPEDVRSLDRHRRSHDADLLELLDLSAEIGTRPDPLVVFAVQPADMSAGEGLSEPVRARLPALVDALEATVDDL